MKIETKFNVGDTFVAIKDGKAVEMIVGSTHIFIHGDKVSISYNDNNWSIPFKSFDESVCFKSKEELIASL